jgi:hypothetical protein
MFRTILSDIGSYASITSLLLTAYIAWSLRRVKNTYIFRFRAPQFAKDLTTYASTLIELGNDFDNSKEAIGIELAKADVRLRYVQSRMRGASRNAVKELRLLIREYNLAPDDKDKLYLVYRGLHGVVEEVKELQEDLNLE